MAVTKNKSVYVCQNCGYESVKWYGRCPDCGEWNSLVEEVRQQVSAGCREGQIRLCGPSSYRFGSTAQ